MKAKLCRHGLQICEKCAGVTDAAKRMSDQINAHITFSNPFELRSKWMAFRLADGGTDGTLYDSKRDAVRHQSDEKLCAYFCFRNALGGTTPKDCQLYLDFNRAAYDSGFRLPDPDDRFGGLDHIHTFAGYDRFTGRVR